MKKNYPYLNDLDFLTKIINIINPVYYTQVSLLNKQQELIRVVTGKTVSANINIDGNSAVRRTANLSFVMEEKDKDAQSLFQLNKKIYLQIGYQNFTEEYKQFPIIWFPLGMYVITNLSFSHNLSGTTFTLSLKDKMCLLNGQCGGVLPAATIFDNYEVQDDNGQIKIVYPTIYQIITELVNHFGEQQLGNIIISDLDTKIKQIMQWTGSVPLYILKGGNQGGFFMTTDEIDALDKIQRLHYLNQPGSPFEAGTNVGFSLVDFAYPGDLIGNAGDSVVTILDKIKNTLGNFEYFYDLQGHFRFQEIKNYLNNSPSKYILESLRQQPPVFVPEYLNSTGLAYLTQRTNGRAVFSFKTNNNLVTSYSNTPQIQNIKNDFVVWGLRKTISGQDYPIRYHLAIDKKPKVGNSYEVIKYVDFYDENVEKWYKPIKFANKNLFPKNGTEGIIYYDENQQKAYAWKRKDDLFQYVQIDASLQTITTKDWRTQLYFQGVIAEPLGINSNFYYPELITEWPKIYDIKKGQFKSECVKDASQIDYYLDFINPVSENMRKLSVGNIGRKTVILNKNNDVNCIFQPYIPDVIIIKLDYTQSGPDTDMRKIRDECDRKGFDYCQVEDDIYNYLIPGLRLNSGYEEVRQSLYQYINYSENISIQTLPIYFLEPNTCIEVCDEDSFINGNYIINSLSFSLDYSSSLSINASKLLERF